MFVISRNTYVNFRQSTEKRHRQDVCALHSDAYALVAEEVDTNLELECQIIARRRREAGFECDDFNYNESIYFSKLG